jgi:alkylation response protein AidB-like acyl-CoA dehydrogenase
MLPDLDEALSVLSKHAEQADEAAVWPHESWSALAKAGVLKWNISPSYGGAGWSTAQLLQGYERLAGACLTTAFILSQRDAACRRLHECSNEALRRKIVPPLVDGRAFITVGVSQLTTSRQHTTPALVARQNGDKFILDGVIPWVTGGFRAQHMVIGATLEDGRQILAVLPTDLGGVAFDPPLPLMALEGSLTTEVRCKEVALSKDWLVAGPAENVMATVKGGTGGLETSSLALGLAGAATDHLKAAAHARAELRVTAERLEQTRQSIRQEMHASADRGCTLQQAASLRARANALVLQATQATLTASKGTGFLRQHPAQRWARQALFFLVWSCPRPAAEATLAYLTPGEGPSCS